jgi:putative transposase
MPQSFVSLHHHLVFSTKNRALLIDDNLQPRLFEYMGGIARDLNTVLVTAGGIEDHVHLLVSIRQDIAIADLMRILKAGSSKWIHETFSQKRDFAWQAGYGAFAVSFSQVPAVKQYLATQREHHRQQSFQEEFITMLDKHEISYNEKYLWE